MDLHICTTCNPPHVENCPKCFGYGLMDDSDVPIAAGEIEYFEKNRLPYAIHACPVCGGTPWGIIPLPINEA